MSTRQATPPTYRSGHCALDSTPDAHRRCRGHYANTECGCDCHRLPDPCSQRLRGRWGDYDQWPCVRAAGHDGDCYSHPDSLEYNAPLDTWGHAALVSEFRMRLAQHAAEAADLRACALRDQRALHHAVNRLIALAPANGGRKNIPAADIRAVWRDALDGKTEAPTGGLAGHRQTPRAVPPGDADAHPKAIALTHATTPARTPADPTPQEPARA